ncbi:MAG: ATP-binding protein [Raoultibacter sp.]
MSQDLTDFIEVVTGESHLRVEDDLGDGFVRLRSSEAERRQAQHDIRSTEDIVIEMLRNARDAGARSIFLAVARDADKRLITMIDDGSGIPQAMQERVFESRVTSKLDSVHLDRWGIHGRGMALFSIRSNVERAQVVSSDKGKGSAFLVQSDTKVLSEKTDQSSMPLLAFDEAANLSVRGPRNINRTVIEFALEEQNVCTVYLGSPTEIAATLFAFGQATTVRGSRAFCRDVTELPLTKRLFFAGDPADFVSIAETLGLSLSQRSARRILDGDIEPISPVTETLSITGGTDDLPSKKKRHPEESDTYDARGLKISPEDLADFSSQISQIYQGLARDYYLDPAIQPNVTVRKDEIVVHIPVHKLR